MIGRKLSADIGHVGRFQPAAQRRSGFDGDYRLRQLRHVLTGFATKHEGPPPTRRPILRAGYVDILQGLGGVVVRPDFFDDVAYDIPDVLWSVDDVWLSGMLARRQIPIWLPAGVQKPRWATAGDVDALDHSTIDGANRSQANQRCVEYMQQHFGIWLPE